MGELMMNNASNQMYLARNFNTFLSRFLKRQPPISNKSNITEEELQELVKNQANFFMGLNSAGKALNIME